MEKINSLQGARRVLNIRWTDRQGAFFKDVRAECKGCGEEARFVARTPLITYSSSPVPMQSAKNPKQGGRT
jgi:hypothetical protein